MPSADIVPFRLRPSVIFAVQQAVLMVLGEDYPMTITVYGPSAAAAHALSRVLSYGEASNFVWRVQRAFREISARYDLQEIAKCR